MNSPDWQRRLQELELDLDRQASDRSQNQTATPDSNDLPTDTQAQLSSLYHQAKTWFQNLPTVGKIGVGVGALVLGLSVLQTVVRLVTLAISLSILGVLGYVAYRLFFSDNQPPSSAQ
jgi:cytosine/uracil/thiamine/allantoin permease